MASALSATAVMNANAVEKSANLNCLVMPLPDSSSAQPSSWATAALSSSPASVAIGPRWYATPPLAVSGPEEVHSVREDCEAIAPDGARSPRGKPIEIDRHID